MVKIDHLEFPKFELGKCAATHRAAAFLSTCSIRVEYLLRRHACGDWGDITDAEKAANEAAIGTDSSIMSGYIVDDTKVWVYTNQKMGKTLVCLSGDNP